jgi:hypothetical protein
MSLNIRRFLNPKAYGGRASIIAIYSDPKPNRYDTEPEITLELSDCSRTVCFEFYLGDSKCRRAAIHKVNALADTINAFRDHLLNDVHPSIEREAERRANRKKDRKKTR